MQYVTDHEVARRVTDWSRFSLPFFWVFCFCFSDGEENGDGGFLTSLEIKPDPVPSHENSRNRYAEFHRDLARECQQSGSRIRNHSSNNYAVGGPAAKGSLRVR